MISLTTMLLAIVLIGLPAACIGAFVGVKYGDFDHPVQAGLIGFLSAAFALSLPVAWPLYLGIAIFGLLLYVMMQFGRIVENIVKRTSTRKTRAEN